MAKGDWELLFSKYDLRAVLENQLAQVNDKVLRVPRERFTSESNELIAAQVASELVASPIEVLEDDITVSPPVDVKVDVSHDFSRALRDDGPAYVDGVQVTYHVPFLGDKELFRCRPSTWTTSIPHAVIGENELRFPYARADRDISATKPKFQRDLADVKKWLGWVNAQVVEYNASLESRVRQRVAQRRDELTKDSAAISSLGFKVRTTQPARSAAPPTPQARQARRQTKRERARRQYDVALSFAGEDRAYVEQVVGELKSLGISVFYDKDEAVHLWGKDLTERLGEVYGKDSRFVVLFLSRHYAEKAWPTHEKRYALGRQIVGEKDRLLPVRFDDTEIPGLPSTMAFLDLRVLTPEKLAELIRQKIDAEDGGS